MGSNREIDEAIDRAVRDILSVEPRAGLRGRVLDRLERPAAGWFTLPRVAGAGAMVALAVIAFLIMRPAPQPTAPAELATHTAPAALQDAATSRKAAMPSTETATASPRSREVAPRRQMGRSAQAAARTPARVDIAEFPAPGVVAAATVAAVVTDAGDTTGGVPLPLDPSAEPIAIPAIHVQPLTIERIVVAPIPSAR